VTLQLDTDGRRIEPQPYRTPIRLVVFDHSGHHLATFNNTRTLREALVRDLCLMPGDVIAALPR
jgi:hypothetical protein